MSFQEKEIRMIGRTPVLASAVKTALLTTETCEKIRPSHIPRVNSDQIPQPSKQIDLQQFMRIFPFLGTLMAAYSFESQQSELTSVDILKALGSDHHLLEIRSDFEMIGANTRQMTDLLLADLLMPGQTTGTEKNKVLAWPNLEKSLIRFEFQPGAYDDSLNWSAVHLGQLVCPLDEASAKQIIDFQRKQKEVTRLIMENEGRTIPMPTSFASGQKSP